MKSILSALLSVSIFFTTMPQAQALVGVIISNKTVKTIGGLSTLAGASGMALGFLGTVSFGNSITFLAFSLFGATTGLIGLVILDEKSGELKFSQLSLEQAQKLGIDQDDAQIFNNEVEELNLLKDEIEAKITDNTLNEEVVDHWREGLKYLSPETFSVAAKIIDSMVQIKK